MTVIPIVVRPVHWCLSSKWRLLESVSPSNAPASMKNPFFFCSWKYRWSRETAWPLPLHRLFRGVGPCGQGGGYGWGILNY